MIEDMVLVNINGGSEITYFEWYIPFKLNEFFLFASKDPQMFVFSNL